MLSIRDKNAKGDGSDLPSPSLFNARPLQPAEGPAFGALESVTNAPLQQDTAVQVQGSYRVNLGAVSPLHRLDAWYLQWPPTSRAWTSPR